MVKPEASSFSVNGPAVWNSLLVDLRAPDISIDIFKNQLKAFLFTFPSTDCAFAAYANLARYKCPYYYYYYYYLLYCVCVCVYNLHFLFMLLNVVCSFGVIVITGNNNSIIIILITALIDYA